ncbi:Tyrosine recombinase XerC [Porphyromonas levii]|uniref:site-specific integrase n=1 Tax=Porphyromonas levii TaxID=28114 RepID=UPI001B8C0946|nr:site-specific integrase [Porphyromonas levii]MBR8731407.1 Tyrosine recombinase XerC [Porphyromonas levii]MBR8759809.1 Tyrosine recombinase XerC [Porphyromonas levii]
MQKSKMRVLLYLKKSSLNKEGKAPIMGRITVGRSMAQFSCKLSCDPELWNTRESRLNGKSRETVVVNSKLEQILLAVHNAFSTLKERGEPFDARAVKELFQGGMESQITLLARFDTMIEELKTHIGIDIKPNTLNSYYQARNHLQKFILNRYKVKDLVFGQLTEDFLMELERYIKGEKGLSQSYYRAIAIKLKKVCRLAYKEGILDRQLFESVRLEQGDNKLPKALDRVAFEKLKGLKFHELETELEQARDLFLFACYSGVAYCDLVSITKKELSKNEEGALWLKYRRQKTDTLCRIKLLPEAIRLIEKYNNSEREELFPAIAYPEYMAQLKALRLRAGISLPFTSHTARHTFATLITLEQGVPIETVSRMLGHTRLETTERYAKVTPKKLFEEFDLFLSFTAELSITF